MTTTTYHPRPFGGLSKFVQRTVTRFHIIVYQASGGRLGAYLGSVPCLLLTTTGRKSGKPRTTVLTYARDGERTILIASNGGTLTDPVWWRNLKAQPRAEIQIGRERYQVTAREARPEERERLWNLAVQVYSGYDGYQQRTPRAIPVVVLEKA